jgi:broad specificity phosphatase PhoE
MGNDRFALYTGAFANRITKDATIHARMFHETATGRCPGAAMTRLMTRFWWVRHGPTHGRGMVGWTDLSADLSDRAAVARLDAALPRGAVLVSSDLRRAVQTADALGPGRQRLPNEPGLREIHFGAWELRNTDEARASHPRAAAAFWAEGGAAPGGERWSDLLGRVSGTVARLAAHHPDRDIVAVAHFGVILAALALAEGRDARRFPRRPIAELSVTEIALDARGWRIGRVNRRL